MKNIEIKLGSHRAVIRFKKIPYKKFSSLRWALIEQNIGAIDTGSIISKSDKSSSTEDNNEG